MMAVNGWASLILQGKQTKTIMADAPSEMELTQQLWQDLRERVRTQGTIDYHHATDFRNIH